MSSLFYNGIFISTWFESIECVLFFVCQNFVSTWFPFSFNEPNMVIIMKNNFMDKRWMNTMKLCFLMKNMQYIIYKYFYLLSRVYNRYWRHYLFKFSRLLLTCDLCNAGSYQKELKRSLETLRCIVWNATTFHVKVQRIKFSRQEIKSTK